MSRMIVAVARRVVDTASAPEGFECRRGKTPDSLGALARSVSPSQTTTWLGQTADATAVLIHYTFAVDANVDGSMNRDDHFFADAGFVSHSGGFFNGDFDYNGRLNADDYFFINSNYNKPSTLVFTFAPNASEQRRPDDLLGVKDMVDLLLTPPHV